MGQTKQGVRDLNGPSLTGSGYNGNRSVGCPHFRDPQFPTTRREELRMVDGLPKKVSVFYCNACGTERHSDTDRDVA